MTPEHVLPAGDGVLLVDKPAGMTSHDVVSRCRRLARTRRVGHAGTLDPMATGLLIIGVNKGTKLLTHLVGCDKEYLATMRLGESTLTEDAEGETTAVADPAAVEAVTDAAIRAAAARLTGSLQQVPSAVSAIKVDGKRSYARVRSGEDVELPARPVTVHTFEITSITRPRVGGRPVIDVEVRVEVSSGTYVRALARDLGDTLGVGGHLTALRRTRVGDFDIARAYPLAQLMDAAGLGSGEGATPAVTAAPWTAPLLTLAEAASEALPVASVDGAAAQALGHGRTAPAGEGDGDGGPVIAAIHEGDVVALVRRDGDRYHPVTVFQTAT